MEPTDDPFYPLPLGPVASLGEMQQAIRAFITGAQAANVHHLVWVSPDFAGWPLDEPELLDALGTWARQPASRLTWVGQDFERIRRAMPRLTRWRQTFAHRVSCRSPEEVSSSDLPTLLLADTRAVLRVVDIERVRGWVRRERADVARAQEEIDALLQRSTEAFPAVTLGL